jgi:osmotically-inducible protein OsmY
MNKVLKVVGAIGLGAGLMYLLDPDRGKRRRALLRNKAEHATRIAADVAGKTRRDVRNHLRGVFAEVQSLCRTREVSDSVLEARVRSKLGRVVSHPHAVAVKTDQGIVTLSGPVLADELHPLLDAVAAIGGVKSIENWVEVHEQPGTIPALQGGRPLRGDVLAV